MTESHALPKLTRTALALVNAQHQANLQQIAKQSIEALGLDESLEWHVNFDAGTVSRTVPDPASPE